MITFLLVCIEFIIEEIREEDQTEYGKHNKEFDKNHQP